jgi:hypothetical protein
MTLKTLREMRDAAPFKPFEIQLADGRSLTVATPDHLFFMPNNKEFLLVFPDNGFRFVDAAQVVSAGSGPARVKARWLAPFVGDFGALVFCHFPLVWRTALTFAVDWPERGVHAAPTCALPSALQNEMRVHLQLDVGAAWRPRSELRRDCICVNGSYQIPDVSHVSGIVPGEW